MNKIEEIKKEYRMVLDDAFEDKSYLADKPQMLEEDALFEQVLDRTWNFIEQAITKSNEEAYKKGREDMEKELTRNVLLEGEPRNFIGMDRPDGYLSKKYKDLTQKEEE